MSEPHRTFPLLAAPAWPGGAVSPEKVLALLRARRVEAILLSAIVAVVVAGYADTATSLVRRWSTDPNYSHGFLVPLVSAYLLWTRLRDSKPTAVEGGRRLGPGLLLLGLGTGFFTVLVPSLFVECVSLLLVLAGLVVFLGGRSLWRIAWPGLVFLIFMVPWPSAVYSRIAFPLQLFVSRISAVALEIVGVPVFRDGNLLHLPGETMHVAEACSGLRQLTAFLAICAYAAVLLERPMWFRGVLLASAVPIAVWTNAVRVTGTGLLVFAGLGQWTEGALHAAEGLGMVVLGMVVLFLEIRLLDWLTEAPIEPLEKGAPHAA